MNNGVILSEFAFEDEKIIHKTSQPTEDLILERNKELRKTPGAINDFGANNEGGTWGRQLASIPIIIYEKAIRDGFDLNNTDKAIAANEMYRFLSTDIGKACMVR